MGKGTAGGKVAVEAEETPRLRARRDHAQVPVGLDGQDEPITGVQVEPPTELATAYRSMWIMGELYHGREKAHTIGIVLLSRDEKSTVLTGDGFNAPLARSLNSIVC